MPNFKSVVFCKEACRVCHNWWTDLSNKNCWCRKHKGYPTKLSKEAAEQSDTTFQECSYQKKGM